MHSRTTDNIKDSTTTSKFSTLEQRVRDLSKLTLHNAPQTIDVICPRGHLRRCCIFSRRLFSLSNSISVSRCGSLVRLWLAFRLLPLLASTNAPSTEGLYITTRPHGHPSFSPITKTTTHLLPTFSLFPNTTTLPPSHRFKVQIQRVATASTYTSPSNRPAGFARAIDHDEDAQQGQEGGRGVWKGDQTHTLQVSQSYFLLLQRVHCMESSG